MFVFLMLGRFALTMAYNVGYLYAAEVYPTEIRAQTLSVRQAFGSLGKFLSSQIVMLVSRIGNDYCDYDYYYYYWI